MYFCRNDELGDRQANRIGQDEQEDVQANDEAHSVKWIRQSLLLGLMVWQKIGQVSDKSLKLLIVFLKAFFWLLADICGYQQLHQLASSIPISLEAARKALGLEGNDFTSFVACPKCHTLYELDKVNDGTIKKCTFIRWPQHQQLRKRQKCNKSLVIAGTSKPKCVYAYRSIKTYLETFIKRPNFIQCANAWKSRSIKENMYSDIYDGNIWKRHNEYLMSSNYNLMGLLNVDWFQPYKHTPYSLGAIYLIILNLPREVRFREENVMILGIIPGPKEPSLHMNSYIQPIVDELLSFDVGLHLKDVSKYGNIYRFRLLGISCDLPACRKIGGMVSYSAKLGMPKLVYMLLSIIIVLTRNQCL